MLLVREAVVSIRAATSKSIFSDGQQKYIDDTVDHKLTNAIMAYDLERMKREQREGQREEDREDHRKSKE